NETFIGSPTKLKLAFRRVTIPIFIAIGLGLVLGLIAGGISQIFFLPQISLPNAVTRSVGWLLIGMTVGLAEGLTWYWQSIEAGDKRRFIQRFLASLLTASIASLLAAFLFEYIRNSFETIPLWFRQIEDILGFCLLGLLLGLGFSLTNSPSYMVALRAGSGFEYTNSLDDEDLGLGELQADEIDSENLEKVSQFNGKPRLNPSRLQFVTDSELEDIEEGLSIRLPARGKVVIGTKETVDIYIPNLPPYLAELELKGRTSLLKVNPQFRKYIQVNGERINSRKTIYLKHNDLITFYSQEKDDDNEEKMYRFVYYNRFLDPQA
ncbi:MAG: hypothetical protein GVY17_10010, partial [Cyanobacteria bacterium]|nr:hypothetical protein [Cyanobacteria bacterium GSL.Bin21]